MILIKTSVRRPLSVLTILVLMSSLLFCPAFAEQSSWDCPKCGRTGNTGNFCGTCSHPSPAPASEATPTPRSVKAGDVVCFGRYEQDNNSENGREAIEWIVLDVDGKNNKALLLSRYGLRGKPYNTKSTDITWEKCTLRSWLNDTFFSSVFSGKEQAAILTTKVDNSSSQGYSDWEAENGKNTQDKLFLLSYKEAKRYLDAELSINRIILKSRVEPTAYAVAQGAFVSSKSQTEDGKAAGMWWLRSPGNFQVSAAYVNHNGLLDYDTVDDTRVTVRPALWIDLESGII